MPAPSDWNLSLLCFLPSLQDDFSGSDLDDDDEDEEEEPDPYGFRANIQALVDNPGKSSMQVRDLPTPEAASISGKQRQELPAFNNQEPGVARQDFAFNNQSAGEPGGAQVPILKLLINWLKRWPATGSRPGSASHGAEARPNRGLGDVVESRKSRSRSFAVLVQVGQQAVDHDQQARSGRLELDHDSYARQHHCMADWADDWIFA